MITRKELLSSKEYWLAQLQQQLYETVIRYLNDNNMTRSELASKMGVSRGYISQILNGNFDHKMSTFIELSLAIEKVPFIKLEDMEKSLLKDSTGILPVDVKMKTDQPKKKVKSTSDIIKKSTRKRTGYHKQNS